MNDTAQEALLVCPLSLSGFGADAAFIGKRHAVKVTWAGLDWDDEEEIMYQAPVDYDVDFCVDTNSVHRPCGVLRVGD